MIYLVLGYNCCNCGLTQGVPGLVTGGVWGQTQGVPGFVSYGYLVLPFLSGCDVFYLVLPSLSGCDVFYLDVMCFYLGLRSCI